MSFKDRLRVCLVKILSFLYWLCRPFIKIDKKLVVFSSSAGENYTGNPRAIYEKLVDLGLDKEYKCVWFFHKGKSPIDLPGEARIVRYEWPQFFYYMAKAGIWIFDSRQPSAIRKKKKQQLYIQTWHGTPLKKLALDMTFVNTSNHKDIDKYRKAFQHDTKIWDCLVAQNEFSADIFRRCFDFEGRMLLTGYPRNDLLFRENSPERISALKRKYNIPEDKKVLLYAPTWRDDEYDGQGNYGFTPHLDFSKLREAIGSQYVVIVKYHYFIAGKLDWSSFEGFVYQISGTGDIGELYLMADALITDYSSVMFDYSLLKKPMLFYAYDLEKYRDQLRGFYFDFLGEVPGPVSTTTEELIEDIKALSGTGYTDLFSGKYLAFSKKYHSYETGSASEQIIELIKEHSE